MNEIILSEENGFGFIGLEEFFAKINERDKQQAKKHNPYQAASSYSFYDFKSISELLKNILSSDSEKI